MKVASGSSRQRATSLASGAQITPEGRTYPQGPWVAAATRPVIDKIRARVRSGDRSMLVARSWVMAAAPGRPGRPAPSGSGSGIAPDRRHAARQGPAPRPASGAARERDRPGIAAAGPARPGDVGGQGRDTGRLAGPARAAGPRPRAAGRPPPPLAARWAGSGPVRPGSGPRTPRGGGP